MIKNKKAQNDVSILFALAFFMFFSTLSIYYITTEFGDNSSNPNLTGDSSLELIGRLLFWRYPYLPFWLDAIWKILELLVLFIVYRAIRSGAG
jgi:hypothetical protein